MPSHAVRSRRCHCGEQQAAHFRFDRLEGLPALAREQHRQLRNIGRNATRLVIGENLGLHRVGLARAAVAAAFQVVAGGVLVFIAGILIGSS